MSTQRKLVRLTVTSSALLGATFFPALLTTAAITGSGALGALMGCMASVAGGNVANAIDALTPGREPGWVGLENEDLTRAVGKAIGLVLMLVAKEYEPETGKLQGLKKAPVYGNLRAVAQSAADNWLAYEQREDYSALKEDKIEAIITPILADSPAPDLLDAADWQEIFLWLNKKAKPGGGYFSRQKFMTRWRKH